MAPVAEPEAVETAPAWVHQPLSWEKLETLEAWLASEAAAHDASLRIEAELQLNEGRLLFSQKDLEKKAVPQPTLQVRVEASKAGFEKILADPAASPGQRARAQIGQRGAVAMIAAPATAPTSELTLVTRKQWGAKPANPTRMTPLKGAWSRITVHHSAESSSDPEGGSLEDSIRTVRLIQKYHMEDENHRWGDIGYHFLIDSDGRIFEGRDLAWQGAHAGGPNGSNNLQNVGVCLLGDLEKRPPTPAALKSLQLLLDQLRAQYRIPAAKVYAHKQLVVTECPGEALAAWLKKYR